MKKLFTLAFALFVFSTFLKAQTSGGPDAYGYIWRDNADTLTPGAPVYNWIDIVSLPGATQVKSLGDDNTAGAFSIGFNFHYYWYDRTSFRIGSNGYIIFNNGAIASPFHVMPSTIAPQDYIGAMTSDITFTDAASNPIPNADCWFYTTPGNDSLIVSWISVPFYEGTVGGTGFSGENTFQMILTSVDSSITFQYKTQVGSVFFGPASEWMAIGIENVSGTVGLAHSADAYPPIDHAIKFYYPATSTLAISDASTNFNNNPSTGGLFLNLDSNDVFLLETEIENTGNLPLNPFNVTSRMQNAASAVILTSTVQSDTLQPAQTQLITHPVSWIPGLAGLYSFVTNTLLPGDLVVSNNQKVMEIRVIDSTKASATLQYEDATSPTGATALSWTGGNGGGGYYFVPPYYPCVIDTISAWVVSNLNNVNFYMAVFDDDGPFASPGTRLDSQQVFNPAVTAPGSWFSIVLPTPIQIDSGGFYLSWMMDGDGISLGTDVIPPISNRTFEVLGNNWAIYRDREVTDLMIRATIRKVSSVGIENPVTDSKSSFGDFYPNPSNEAVNVKFTMADGVKNVSYTIYDMQGKNISSASISLKGKDKGVITVPTEKMKSGIYNCKFEIDGKLLNRRFVINR